MQEDVPDARQFGFPTYPVQRAQTFQAFREAVKRVRKGGVIGTEIFIGDAKTQAGRFTLDAEQ